MYLRQCAKFCPRTYQVVCLALMPPVEASGRDRDGASPVNTVTALDGLMNGQGLLIHTIKEMEINCLGGPNQCPPKCYNHCFPCAVIFPLSDLYYIKEITFRTLSYDFLKESMSGFFVIFDIVNLTNSLPNSVPSGGSCMRLSKSHPDISLSFLRSS